MATLAPPQGALPVLQYCTPDQLQIDTAYQRALDDRSQRLVADIARGWDWGLCQPLVVARRVEGDLFVVDGQHRLAAAKLRGDIAQLPCVLFNAINAASEAETFVKLNQQRRPLTAFALYRAAVAAGEAEAVALETIVRACGLSVAGASDPAKLKPGQLNNVGKLRAFHHKHGDEPTRQALRILAGSFHDQVFVFGGTLFSGVIATILGAPDDFDEDLFIAVLGADTQEQWMGAFRKHAAEHAIGVVNAAGAVMLASYAEAAAE